MNFSRISKSGRFYYYVRTLVHSPWDAQVQINILRVYFVSSCLYELQHQELSSLFLADVEITWKAVIASTNFYSRNTTFLTCNYNCVDQKHIKLSSGTQLDDGHRLVQREVEWHVQKYRTSSWSVNMCSYTLGSSAYHTSNNGYWSKLMKVKWTKQVELMKSPKSVHPKINNWSLVGKERNVSKYLLLTWGIMCLHLYSCYMWKIRLSKSWLH